MNILGFNCFGHDSSATLLIDGQPHMAVEEERLNRKKHFGGFPDQSIEACLKNAGLGIADLDHIGYSWDPKITYSKMPVFLMQNFTKTFKLLKERREWSMEENLGMLNYLPKIRALPNFFSEMAKKEGRNPKFKFHFLEHHTCHAASAFFCSPFEEAAILTVDGAGEWATATLAKGHQNKIEKIAQIDTPHSLGAFYQAISRHLGFKLIEGPGKLMGLSSYGSSKTETGRELLKLIKFNDDGTFK
ncbi:MAG: hypothetical protein EOP04_24850, partial [Proteobacteria bacterium]